MIRSYCFDTENDWDEGIHLLLFAVRESVQESLGFSPFELVFGHTVRGPLNLLKEKFLSQEDTPLNLLQYISNLRSKLLTACEAAKSNLKKAQGKMKQTFDKNTKERSFKSGDKVLALLPVPGRPLQARYFGPYTVEKKASDLKYIITTPDRRKQKQLCHINMLKEYVDRDSSNVAPVNISSSVPQKQSEMNCEEVYCEEMNFHRTDPTCAKLQNSDILKDLDKKLSHLDQNQRDELKMLILEYEHLFPDIPTRTDQIYHDVDIEGSKPIKQHPYRMNPMKLQYLREEVQYLFDNDFIEPSQNDWSSPCILVPKSDGTFRMCTDYRKVNSVTKTDSFPVPRMADCIDNIGQAKYVRPLQARYFGPYTVEKKASDLNYIITTPDRRKQKQLCHINMLKEYVDRDSSNVAQVNVISSVPQKQSEMNCEEVDYEEMNFHKTGPTCSKLQNSDILKDLDKKLSHLDQTQRDELKMLILEYEHLFPDIPTRTDEIYHDVDIEGSKPIKQHPYRMNPMKSQYLREEVQYLLDNDFIEPSQSDWSSPCILVPKPDGTCRMCTDYRKVNSVTKTDSFPVPRMDDSIDNIGQAKYVTKFDLLKGFWQIPLTDRAKEISAFVTPDGLYQYKVMPFGMKNSPATFQRLINMIIMGLDNCKADIDDAIIYSEEWDQQIKTIREFFERLSIANLTINLAKSEFCHFTLTFLGHVVGQGQVKPVEAKVKAISDFPVPTCKRQLMRFLGMAGYYRKFYDNFSVIAEPLTNLLSKRTKFIWANDCQKAFDILKAILENEPVLLAPNFAKEFKLAVDDSDTGAGSVLMQEYGNEVDHPVSYFSKKVNKHQKNYSTIEKECLSLILALQHFEVYLTSSPSPIVVFSDHNPLIFIHRMKNKNQRLLRWSLLLQEYNLDISHIKGKDNIISDALSRAYCLDFL